MRFEEIAILLPCHSLEDFPLYHEGEDAEGLLSAWSALWHPALLATTGAAPKWHRADHPPESLAGRLFVIPQISEAMVAAGWPARAETEGARVIRKRTYRQEIVDDALALLGDEAPTIDPDLSADFLALGFCYLQIELLTRQMRYMSNLDELHLERESVAAARAAAEGDVERARGRLRACFEVLIEARERFYPVDCYLLDLTLVAKSTLGPSLRHELASPAPVNLLLSAELLPLLAQREPESLAALQAALEENKASVYGGEYTERELPLLPIESILHELRRGSSEYVRYLQRSPVVFGRRRFGMSLALPQILSRLGFAGVVHATLDEGQFPRGEQSKLRWEGCDGTAIDAFARLPIDAQVAEHFLNLPIRMGDAMDRDHVATLAFAHWPGSSCTWYEDLRRIAAYAPVLGRFVTLPEYFSDTYSPGRLYKFEADQYRAPYLKQLVAAAAPDPLSRYTRFYRRRAAADAVQTLSTLNAFLGGDASGVGERWIDDVERGGTEAGLDGELTQRLDAAVAAQVTGLADRLLGSQAAAGSTAPAVPLVFNPLSFSRRVVVDLPERHEDKTPRRVQVEVPPLGFAWAVPREEPPAAANSRRASTAPRLAADNILRNEHLQITIDPETGGIRSLHGGPYRGNRLSQQLGYRYPPPKPKPGDVWQDPDEVAVYATMRADSVEVTSERPPLGEIVSRGGIYDDEGKRLARFEQRVQLARGARLAVLDIKLQVDEPPPEGDPWQTYYASRFAWADETADLYRTVNYARQPTAAKRLEAPHYVEIEIDEARTAIVTAGLPFHRRVGLRMLDALLAVRGETEQHFRLGIGIELPNPLASALELVAPATVTPPRPMPSGTPPAGWLFNLSPRNIVATHWEPWVEGGRVVGFRARLLETLGRPGRARLRAYRPLEVARHTDLDDNTLVELPIEDDAVLIDFTAHEWVQVEAAWLDG